MPKRQLSRKPQSSNAYVTTCAGCNLPFKTGRHDRVVCSKACRIEAHRSGHIETLEWAAKQFDIEVSDILHARAIMQLCPALEDRMRGDDALTLDDAQDQVVRVFDRLMRQQIRRCIAQVQP
jgi:hypothetical protein